MASSTESSTTSQTRWCRPISPVEPIYIAGRSRTASRPPSTLIDFASYLWPAACGVTLPFSLSPIVTPYSATCLRKSAALNGLRANDRMARALKITFLEARKAYLRIARRLTLCPDSHRDRRVSCSIPSRAARRGEDCLPFKPRLVWKGCFSKRNDSKLLAQSQFPGPFHLADVSILEIPHYASTTEDYTPFRPFSQACWRP